MLSVNKALMEKFSQALDQDETFSSLRNQVVTEDQWTLDIVPRYDSLVGNFRPTDAKKIWV